MDGAIQNNARADRNTGSRWRKTAERERARLGLGLTIYKIAAETGWTIEYILGLNYRTYANMRDSMLLLELEKTGEKNEHLVESTNLIINAIATHSFISNAGKKTGFEKFKKSFSFFNRAATAKKSKKKKAKKRGLAERMKARAEAIAAAFNGFK